MVGRVTSAGSVGEAVASSWGVLVARLGFHCLLLVLLLLPHLSPAVALPTVELPALYPLAPLLFISTAGFAFWIRKQGAGYLPIAAQLACDGIFVAWLTLLTGGVASPYSFLYLVLLCAATLLLPPHGGVVAMVVAINAYLVVGWQGAERESGGAIFSLLNQEAVLPTLLGFIATTVLAHLLAQRQQQDHRRLVVEVARFSSLQAFHTCIVQSIHGGLITLDDRLRVTSANPSAERILGNSEDEIAEMEVGDLFQLPSDLTGQLAGTDKGLRLQCGLVSDPRRGRVVGLSFSPLLDDGGRRVGYVVSFQDLTDVRRLEERVKAREQLAVIGELSARLAHEIRNPLAAISGSVQVIASELATTDRQARLLDIVVRESDRLSALMSDFLNFARPQAMRRAPVDVAAVASDVVELMRYSPDAEGVELLLEPCSGELVSDLDGEALRQCLTNLVSNALQSIHGPDGRVSIIVENRRGDEGEPFVIHVEDNGRGIPQEEIDHIFFPFFSRREGGTGLGLSVAKGLVEAHDGRLVVESSPGEGSRFSIVLPPMSCRPGGKIATKSPVPG